MNKKILIGSIAATILILLSSFTSIVGAHSTREATVMIQNTDGTFSQGFKPRKK